MNGLINRSVQSFLIRTKGYDVWEKVAARAGVPPAGFEAMSDYPSRVTLRLIAAILLVTSLNRQEFLEEFGTFIVTHPTVSAVRRLLRYGGASYTDFLISLEDLRHRTRLAVGDLPLPEITAEHPSPGCVRLILGPGPKGMAQFFIGVLGAMADEYGSLVTFVPGIDAGRETLTVRIAEMAFAAGREFEMAATL